MANTTPYNIFVKNATYRMRGYRCWELVMQQKALDFDQLE